MKRETIQNAMLSILILLVVLYIGLDCIVPQMQAEIESGDVTCIWN